MSPAPHLPFFPHRNIKTVGVSAVTGTGVESMFLKIDEAGVEFRDIFVPELRLRLATQKEQQAARQVRDLARLADDLKISGGDKVTFSARKEPPSGV